MPPKQKNPSEQQMLSKTLAFLTSVAQSCRSLSVNEIADELDVSKPTAYTIVNSLVAQGYLEREESSPKYHIGYRFYVMGQNYYRLYPFLVYLEDPVINLHRQFGMRINICVFKEPMTALVVASKDSSIIPRHSGGYLLPAHISASGKVLLANMPPEEALAHIEAGSLYAMTQYSITDKATLLTQLDAVRANGYATDEQELVCGTVCVAAPVYDAAGRILCTMSIAKCPIDFFRDNRELLISTLKSTCMQISMDMGLPREAAIKLYNL